MEGEGAAALKTAAGRRQAAAAGLEGPPPARTVSEYLGGKVKLLSFLFDHFRVKHVWEDDSNSNNNSGDPGFDSIVGKGKGVAKKKSGRVSRHSGDSMTRQQFTLMYVEESEERWREERRKSNTKTVCIVYTVESTYSGMYSVQ